MDRGDPPAYVKTLHQPGTNRAAYDDYDGFYLILQWREGLCDGWVCFFSHQTRRKGFDLRKRQTLPYRRICRENALHFIVLKWFSRN
jgi:hypothetical protein